MAKTDDTKSPTPDSAQSAPATPTYAALEQRVARLERDLSTSRGGSGPAEGGGDSVRYQLDRLNAIAIKYHNGDLMDYDRNALFLQGKVATGNPENIGPTPPRPDDSPPPSPVDPKVSFRGDQVTPAGEQAGALTPNLPV